MVLTRHWCAFEHDAAGRARTLSRSSCCTTACREVASADIRRFWPLEAPQERVRCFRSRTDRKRVAFVAASPGLSALRRSKISSGVNREAMHRLQSAPQSAPHTQPWSAPWVEASLALLCRMSTSRGASGWSTGCLVLSSVRGHRMNVCRIIGAQGLVERSHECTRRSDQKISMHTRRSDRIWMGLSPSIELNHANGKIVHTPRRIAQNPNG